MDQKTCYKEFPPIMGKDDIVNALVNDPPEIRWRVVRELFRIEKIEDRKDLIEALQAHLYSVEDARIKHRITLALMALHHPLKESDYVLVKGKGAFRESEYGAETDSETDASDLFPIIDFHIHPKAPDFNFFRDMKEAGVTHGVVLGTDTDPEDVERPEIREKLEKNYAESTQAQRTPFEHMLKHIKASLYSNTHVTTWDAADWMNDYPGKLFAFGSVNLSKDRDYVEKKLDIMEKMKLRGVKLLPYSQFFNPRENEHMDLLLDYCRQTNSIILSHCGCGAGPFEILELSRDSHPALWEPMLKKYPEVPLVLAHAGAYSTHIPGIWLYETLQLGKKYKNLYVDLAAVDWIIERENVVKEIRKTIGFDRVLFGTDYPLPVVSGVKLTYIVSGIKANTNLTEKEKRKILGENAAKLLKIN